MAMLITVLDCTKKGAQKVIDKKNGQPISRDPGTIITTDAAFQQ